MFRKPVLFTLGNAVCDYLAPIELWRVTFSWLQAGSDDVVPKSA